MNKELIKNLIVENQEFVGTVELMPRPLVLEENGNYAFVGLRRAGKTFLMYQHIHTLLRKGTTINEILYINFEDERLTGMTSENLSLIIDCYKELYSHKPFLFFDEIQVIKGWEKFVRRLADTGYRTFITGSNAKMLSREIVTTLGGRFIIKEVLPYTFREFLTANGIDITKNITYGHVKTSIIQLFQTFFYYGGLPELLRFTEKRYWLNSLYQKIFFGDLITRYNIRNDFALKIMVKKLAESVMQPMSFNRLYNIVASTGVKVGKSTIIEYVDYLAQNWLIFSVSNIAAKLSEQEANRKYYFYDNGILNLFLFRPETILLENLTAIALKKRYGDDLYFYNKTIEVDFYIPEEKLAVQVAYDLVNNETYKRETSALHKFSRVIAVERMLILTMDEEKVVDFDGTKIEIMPLWKWLTISGGD